MDRLAISNIALPAFAHDHLLAGLARLGAAGLEVAPSRIWRKTETGPTPAEIARYRRAVEAAGLRVVGLHSLFFDHPELGMFKTERRRETVDFLIHLSAVCRDLGGRTMIYGGGRRRDGLSRDVASDECRRFLEALLPRIESHGTVLCFEPLGPKDTDFLNTAAECLALAEEVAHPALGLQLDAKALVENSETGPATFKAVRGRLAHYHANDPGLGPVGSTGAVDHEVLGQRLAAINYTGWIAIEQRMIDTADPLAAVAESLRAVRAAYLAPAAD